MSSSSQQAVKQARLSKLTATLANEHGDYLMAQLIGEIIDPQFDALVVDEFVTGMASLGLAGPESLLLEFRSAGFGQPLRRSPTASHSNLQWVLSNQQGIPISLAMLLVQSARLSGFEAVGINSPGHFLVQIAGQMIDPMQMNVVEGEALTKAGDAIKYSEASSLAVGLRMLNNLKALHVIAGSFDQALELIDYQLHLAGDEADIQAALQFERGEYWQRLGAYTAAREAYQVSADLSSSSSLKTKAQQLADSLRGRGETLH